MCLRMKNPIEGYHLSILFIVVLCGCTKLVEVTSPITSSNKDVVYASDATATAVLTGVYSKISEAGITSGLNALSLYPELSSDNLALLDGVTDEDYMGYFKNSLTSLTTGGGDFWNNLYPIIFTVNSALEGLMTSTTLTVDVKQQLLGEAKFIRSLCYYYLINLYGDVPLVLSTDYKLNSTLVRTSKFMIIGQIIKDLSEAKESLSPNYLDAAMNATEERISPTKWAAVALLARVYLYAEQYPEAEKEATILIENRSLFDTVSLENVFIKNSKEAIWQIQPVGSFITNTADARFFTLPETGPNIFENKVYLTDNLLNAFELGDKRRTIWIGTVSVNGKSFPYPAKYKNAEPFSPVTEYTMVLRLAEQYLIRAESRARQGKLNEGVTDLNIIRKRAGLLPKDAVTKEDLLISILTERRNELFTEWGHRWFDLKRLDLADEVLASVKGNNWQTSDQLYPIPQSDMDRNPGLAGNQNPGY